MIRKIAAGLFVSLLLATLLPAEAIGAPSAIPGEWVQGNIKDTKAESVEINEVNAPRMWMDFTYRRNSYTIKWHSEFKDTGKTYTSSGTVSAVFSELPQRIKPGERVKLTCKMTSSAKTDYNNPAAKVEDRVFTVAANMNFSVNLEASNTTADLRIPLCAFDGPYEKTESVTIKFPQIEDVRDAAWINLSLYTTHHASMDTEYSYGVSTAAAPASPSPSAAKPSPSAAKPSPTVTGSIQVGGLVRSVEDKPMSWMKLQALVYYGVSKYSGGKPDLTIDGVTDHMGRYRFTIPLKNGDTKPVGILLMGSLSCLYPFEKDKTLFYFVDMGDNWSVTNNQISVGTWLTANPVDAAKAKDSVIRINRLLSFYTLGLDAWSFDDKLIPDPIVNPPGNKTGQKTLEELSALYTAAFDDWFFGALVLNESKALLAKPIRVEARTPLSSYTSSCYTANDNTVRLLVKESKRDDDSRFAIMHEFGHAFDALTLPNGQFRADKGKGATDKNHGGYLNSTTSDSFSEGFATCYAALSALYSGYKHPGKISWVDITQSISYKAWDEYAGSEEMDIAALLLYLHTLVGNTSKYWSLLKPDLSNFKEYYAAFRAALPADKAQKLDDYAYKLGLFKIPKTAGNGRYDKGEPFRDADGDGRCTGNESFGDLMFNVGADGSIDTGSPTAQYKKADLAIGTVSPANMARQTLPQPVDTKLALTGSVPEYVLVSIKTADNETRLLRATADGGVLLCLPGGKTSGTVTVSVPGGKVIYKGDLAALQAKRAGHPNLPVPLDTANVTKEQLAPTTTIISATCGNPGSDGLLHMEIMSAGALAAAAQAYNPKTPIEQVVEDHSDQVPSGSNSGGSGSISGGSSGSSGSGNSGSGYNSSGSYSNSDSSDRGGSVVVVLIVIILAALVVAIVVIAARKGKRSPNAVGPAAQQRPPANFTPVQSTQEICPACGAPLPPNGAFCARCGKPMPPDEPTQTASPAVFCKNCGDRLTPGARFCDRCGHPVE